MIVAPGSAFPAPGPDCSPRSAFLLASAPKVFATTPISCHSTVRSHFGGSGIRGPSFFPVLPLWRFASLTLGGMGGGGVHERRLHEASTGSQASLVRETVGCVAFRGRCSRSGIRHGTVPGQRIAYRKISSESEACFVSVICTSAALLNELLPTPFASILAEGMPVRANDFSQSCVEGPRIFPSM